MKIEQKQKLPVNLIAFTLGVWIIAIGHFASWYEEILPGLWKVDEVLAHEVPKSTQIEDKEEETIKFTVTKLEVKDEPILSDTDIEEKIREYFPNNHKEMIKLFTCESSLDSSRTGDEGLETSGWYNGEFLGRSIGIAQVRTGAIEKNGVVWSRAWKLGMTVEEYENKLRDPDFNLSEAKKIFAGEGYNGWFNCSKRIGLL